MSSPIQGLAIFAAIMLFSVCAIVGLWMAFLPYVVAKKFRSRAWANEMFRMMWGLLICSFVIPLLARDSQLVQMGVATFTSIAWLTCMYRTVHGKDDARSERSSPSDDGDAKSTESSMPSGITGNFLPPDSP